MCKNELQARWQSVSKAKRTIGPMPSFGDASLVVRVCAHNFSGESKPWVARQEFAQFCTALQRLERSLRGEACL